MQTFFHGNMSQRVARSLWIVISLILLLALAGCKSGQPTFDGTHYLDADGNVIDEVTLDVVAQCQYGKDFADCKNGTQKKDVLHRYLSYHADSNEMTSLIDMIMELDVLDQSTPWDSVATVENIQQTLSEGGSALTFTKLYANVRENEALGDFLDQIGDVSDVANYLLQSTKSILLISDLSRTDSSSAQEYAVLTVQTIKSLTDFIPYFGDYFNQSLSIIEEGLKIVIEQYGDYMLWIEAHNTQIDGNRSICTLKGWEILQRPQYWNDTDHTYNIQNSGQHSLSLSEIYSRCDELTDLSEAEQNVLIAYLLFRIPYELEHPEERGPEITEQPTQPKCNHRLEAKQTKKPTCEEAGERTITCAHKCGYYKTEVIDPLGHTYTHTVIDPTFDSRGYTLHTCENCGSSYQDSFVDPLQLPDLQQQSSWYGYGVDLCSFKRRFDLQIEHMNGSTISGFLDVTKLYESTHKTTFTGTCKESKNTLVYEITFAQPAVIGTIPQYEYDTITLIFDPLTNSFLLDGCYDAVLQPPLSEDLPALAENAVWSGLGKDPFYSGNRADNHLFVLNVSEMNETSISGHFNLSYNDATDHDSDFSGRGYKDADVIRYEILLATPRTDKNIITVTVETFWLVYDMQKDTFSINSFYDVDMSRQS